MQRPPHLEFGPPPTPGTVRAVLLALLAHGVLMVALTAGIQWNKEVPVTVVQAELWSSVPHTAAAAAGLEPPPEEAPAPVDAPPTEAPPPPPAPPAATPVADEAAIAIARKQAQKEKEQQEKEQALKAQLAQEKRAQEKAAKARAAQEKAAQEKAAQDKALKEKLAQEKLAQEKLAQEKLAREKRDKQKAQEKTAQDKAAADKNKAQAKAQEIAAAKEAREAKMLDELRQQNMKRIAGMAGPGGNGDANATGKDLESATISPAYGGRIVARIKPNIVFTDDVVGNPRVEVEIRTSVSGNILSSRITQSSGVKAWDAAVLRAIEKTEVLPKDTNGIIPTSITIGFRPKD